MKAPWPWERHHYAKASFDVCAGLRGQQQNGAREICGPTQPPGGAVFGYMLSIRGISTGSYRGSRLI